MAQVRKPRRLNVFALDKGRNHPQKNVRSLAQVSQKIANCLIERGHARIGKIQIHENLGNISHKVL